MYKTIRWITSRIMVATILIGFFSTIGINDVRADGHTHEGWTHLEDSLPDTEGNYYLTKDISMSSENWIVPLGEINLCLNGHSIIMNTTESIKVGYGATTL